MSIQPFDTAPVRVDAPRGQVDSWDCACDWGRCAEHQGRLEDSMHRALGLDRDVNAMRENQPSAPKLEEAA